MKDLVYKISSDDGPSLTYNFIVKVDSEHTLRIYTFDEKLLIKQLNRDSYHSFYILYDIDNNIIKFLIYLRETIFIYIHQHDVMMTEVNDKLFGMMLSEFRNSLIKFQEETKFKPKSNEDEIECIHLFNYQSDTEISHIKKGYEIITFYLENEGVKWKLHYKCKSPIYIYGDDGALMLTVNEYCNVFINPDYTSVLIEIEVGEYMYIDNKTIFTFETNEREEIHEYYSNIYRTHKCATSDNSVYFIEEKCSINKTLLRKYAFYESFVEARNNNMTKAMNILDYIFP